MKYQQTRLSQDFTNQSLAVKVYEEAAFEGLNPSIFWNRSKGKGVVEYNVAPSEDKVTV